MNEIARFNSKYDLSEFATVPQSKTRFKETGEFSTLAGIRKLIKKA